MAPPTKKEESIPAEEDSAPADQNMTPGGSGRSPVWVSFWFL